MLTAEKPEPHRQKFTALTLQQCAERELKFRRDVYKRRVAENRMSATLAHNEIAKMQAIAEHFAELVKSERLL